MLCAVRTLTLHVQRSIAACIAAQQQTRAATSDLQATRPSGSLCVSQRLTLAAGWVQTPARSTRPHSKSSCSQAELSCTSEAQLAPPSAALPPTSSSSPIYAVYSFVREQHCGMFGVTIATKLTTSGCPP